MKIRGAILAAAVLVMGSTAARQALAETVYNQPVSFDEAYYSSVSNQWQAYDNFTLGSDATITSVAWAGETLGSAANSFTISFYSNDGGFPGTLLSSTTVGDGNPVEISGASSDEFEAYSASIDPFSVSAGTEYWLSIFDSNTDPDSEWAWLGGTGGDSRMVSITSAGTASPDITDLAFSLNTTAAATPEPSGLILLGTSLLGAAGIARRRIFGA